MSDATAEGAVEGEEHALIGMDDDEEIERCIGGTIMLLEVMSDMADRVV